GKDAGLLGEGDQPVVSHDSEAALHVRECAGQVDEEFGVCVGGGGVQLKDARRAVPLELALAVLRREFDVQERVKDALAGVRVCGDQGDGIGHLQTAYAVAARGRRATLGP